MMPTSHCNSNCTYCYIPHKNNHKQKENNNIFYHWLEEFIQKIDQNHNSQPSHEIRLIGGEPYLKPELIKNISSRFLSFCDNGKIFINTNGTLLTKERLKNFAPHHRKRIYHIVSLDGIEHVHNARRKLKNEKNAFRETIKGIKLLQKLQMPFLLNMVLDKFTYNYLDAFIDFLIKELNINELGVSLLYEPDKKSKPENDFTLLKKTYAIADKHGIKLSGHHRLKLGHRIQSLQCKAGEKSVLISQDGKLFACQRFVGRTEGCQSIEKLEEIPSGKLHEQVKKTCYCHEQETLGDLLYEMYKTQYPSYLGTTELDKQFFGVI